MGSKELKIFEILVFANSKVVSRIKEFYLPEDEIMTRTWKRGNNHKRKMKKLFY